MLCSIYTTSKSWRKLGEAGIRDEEHQHRLGQIKIPLQSIEENLAGGRNFMLV
jgi:hypothetical protein